MCIGHDMCTEHACHGGWPYRPCAIPVVCTLRSKHQKPWPMHCRTKKCPGGDSNPGPIRLQTSAVPLELNGMVVPVRLAHSEADVLKVAYGLIYIDTRHSWRRNPFACIALVLTGCCSSPLAEVQARSTDFKVTDP